MNLSIRLVFDGCPSLLELALTHPFGSPLTISCRAPGKSQVEKSI